MPAWGLLRARGQESSHGGGPSSPCEEHVGQHLGERRQPAVGWAGRRAWGSTEQGKLPRSRPSPPSPPLPTPSPLRPPAAPPGCLPGPRLSLRPQPWLPFLELSTAHMIRPVEPRCHELSQPQVSRPISKLGTFCCKGSWQRRVGRPCQPLRSVVVKLN